MIGFTGMENTNDIVDVAFVEWLSSIFRGQNITQQIINAVFQIQTLYFVAGNHDVFDRNIL